MGQCTREDFEAVDSVDLYEQAVSDGSINATACFKNLQNLTMKVDAANNYRDTIQLYAFKCNSDLMGGVACANDTEIAQELDEHFYKINVIQRKIDYSKYGERPT